MQGSGSDPGVRAYFNGKSESLPYQIGTAVSQDGGVSLAEEAANPIVSAAHEWEGTDVHAPYVIYVTAHPQHALDAYDAGAVDYVLKPVEEQRLARAIDRGGHRVLAFLGRSHLYEGHGVAPVVHSVRTAESTSYTEL